MKTFDIETFEKNKTGKKFISTTDDGTVIRQYGWDDEYEEIILEKGSYFEKYYSYFKNGCLKLSVERFPDKFLKGLMKEYDEDGRLIKETDYDAPYKFDWGDVLKLIKNRGLDMDNYYFEILRGSSDKGTSWAIIWEKEDKTGLRVVNIDGISGKITREAALEYPSDE